MFVQQARIVSRVVDDETDGGDLDSDGCTAAAGTCANHCYKYYVKDET